MYIAKETTSASNFRGEQGILSEHIFVNMTPKAGSCTDTTESHSKYDDYGPLMKADIVHNLKNIILFREKSGEKGVQELLQCPTCSNSIYPPIQECPNGHTLCANCKRLHNCCPTCQIELGNIRCLALEKVAQSPELPCRYQSLGCNNLLPYHGKIKHERNCPFRPYSCPHASSECPVTGDIPFLVAHLKADHAVDMHDGCTFNHRYVKSNPCEVENAIWMLPVFHCFGRHFCLHFEAFLLGTVPVYMAFIRFMGEDYMARKFSYTLEVKACGRMLVWQGVPRSIRDSHRKVRDSQDGLIIPRSLALCFSGGNGERLKLKLTGRIWKV